MNIYLWVLIYLVIGIIVTRIIGMCGYNYFELSNVIGFILLWPVLIIVILAIFLFVLTQKIIKRIGMLTTKNRTAQKLIRILTPPLDKLIFDFFNAPPPVFKHLFEKIKTAGNKKSSQ